MGFRSRGSAVLPVRRPSAGIAYKTWVEGKTPDVVIETTSRKTKRKDMEVKPRLYARWSVKEYFLCDPTQEYLDPPLQGYRLTDHGYVRIPLDEELARRARE